MLRPGAYAILPKNGVILLTHQAQPSQEYQLPGGGIDPGESPLQALFREVLEETGWLITAPRRLGAFRRFTFMPDYDLWCEKLCHVYLARPVRRRGDPTEANHSAFWARPSVALALLFNEGDREFVGRLFP